MLFWLRTKLLTCSEMRNSFRKQSETNCIKDLAAALSSSVGVRGVLFRIECDWIGRIIDGMHARHCTCTARDYGIGRTNHVVFGCFSATLVHYSNAFRSFVRSYTFCSLLTIHRLRHVRASIDNGTVSGRVRSRSKIALAPKLRIGWMVVRAHIDVWCVHVVFCILCQPDHRRHNENHTQTHILFLFSAVLSSCVLCGNRPLNRR